MNGIVKRIGRLLLHHPTTAEDIEARHEKVTDQAQQMMRHMMEGRQ